MQLQYLGQTYNVQSVSSRFKPLAGPLSRNLQYRGNSYIASMAQPQDAPSPQAVNWRYQVH